MRSPPRFGRHRSAALAGPLVGSVGALALLATLGVAGCRCGDGPAKRDRPPPAPAPAETLAPLRCEADGRFPATLPLPEASAATEVRLAGTPHLLVVSDSGNAGAAVLVRLGGAFEVRNATLDVGRTTDDVEGLAARGASVYALTSSGLVARFSEVADKPGALSRVGEPYAIGPPPLSCPKLGSANCGKNWEGLCLRAEGLLARCAGYAASKSENALYCVVVEEGRLRVDTVKPPLRLTLPERALSDCAFGAAGGPAARTLFVTTNVHGGSKTYVVDEASGELARIDVPGHVTNEAVAVDGTGALYQMQDDNRAPSVASRHVCTGWIDADAAAPAESAR